jgi:hypothetical protein
MDIIPFRLTQRNQHTTLLCGSDTPYRQWRFVMQQTNRRKFEGPTTEELTFKALEGLGLSLPEQALTLGVPKGGGLGKETQ